MRNVIHHRCTKGFYNSFVKILSHPSHPKRVESKATGLGCPSTWPQVTLTTVVTQHGALTTQVESMTLTVTHLRLHTWDSPPVTPN